MGKPCGSTGLMVGCSKVAGTTPFSRVGRKAMSLPLQASARLTPCPASGVQPLVCALPTSAFSRQVKGPSPHAAGKAGRLGRPGWPTPWLRAGAFLGRNDQGRPRPGDCAERVRRFRMSGGANDGWRCRPRASTSQAVHRAEAPAAPRRAFRRFGVFGNANAQTLTLERPDQMRFYPRRRCRAAGFRRGANARHLAWPHGP